MENKPTLEEKIEIIGDYLGQARRLQHLIDNEKDGNSLRNTISNLEKLSKTYDNKLRNMQIVEDTRGGAKPESKYILDIEKKRRMMVINAYKSAFLGSITFLFLPKYSRSCLKKAEEYLSLNKKLKAGIEDLKKIKKYYDQKQKNFIELTGKKEYAEAKLATLLESKGLEEKDITLFIDNPEMYCFSQIEHLKQKYVPWL